MITIRQMIDREMSVGADGTNAALSRCGEIIARFRAVLDQYIPDGYEDEFGFHFGRESVSPERSSRF